MVAIRVGDKWRFGMTYSDSNQSDKRLGGGTEVITRLDWSNTTITPSEESLHAAEMKCK